MFNEMVEESCQSHEKNFCDRGIFNERKKSGCAGGVEKDEATMKKAQRTVKL